MLTAWRTQYLIKSCVKWRSIVHPASLNTCKIAQDWTGKKQGTLSCQVRLFSSKKQKIPEIFSTLTNEDQQAQNSWDVFKKIQKQTGISADAIPTFKYASKEETEFLNTEMKSLSSDWQQLAQFLDGQIMSIDAIVHFVEENIQSASFTVICNLMGTYLKVFKREKKQYRVVLDEAVGRLSNVSLSEALYLVQCMNHLPEEEVETKYYEICQERLKAKLSEMVTPVQIVYAMSMLNRNNMPEVLDMLDNLANEHLSSMKVENLVDLIHIQAIEKRRNPVLMRKCVTSLNMCDLGNLDIHQVTDLFYACASLSIYNQELLQKISKQAGVLLVNSSRNKQMATKHSILYSCSRLHWKDEDLLNILAGHIKNTSKVFKPEKFAEKIICLCNLGFQDIAKVKEFFFTNSEFSIKKKNKYLWIKYIHALATRKAASVSEIQNVLDPAFYSSLTNEDSPPQVRIITKTMLLNLQGCLELDLGVQAPTLKEAETWLSEIKTQRGKNSIVHGVELALKHISLDVTGARLDKYGNKIDFEVQLTRHQGSTKDRVPIGIRVLDFNEMVCGPNKTITASGATAMATRHLKAGNSPLLILPYYKWKSSDISLQNAISLENMLNLTLNPPPPKQQEEQKPEPEISTETPATGNSDSAENRDNAVKSENRDSTENSENGDTNNNREQTM